MQLRVVQLSLWLYNQKLVGTSLAFASSVPRALRSTQGDVAQSALVRRLAVWFSSCASRAASPQQTEHKVRTPQELSNRELLRAWKARQKELKKQGGFFYYDEELAKLEAEVVKRDLDK